MSNSTPETKQCESKYCKTGKYVGASSYICEHNNLAVKFPYLCKEWDYEKNPKRPNEYSYGSRKEVWWICSNNICGCHRWKTTINNRTNGKGCSFCNSGKICEHNNLAVKFPDLCKEWDYEKNNDKPENYSYSSGKMVWWKCKNDPCGCHSWEAYIYNRTLNESGCPFCAHTKLCPHNNLLFLYPKLCQEWNYAENSKPPSEYPSCSKEQVLWTCSNNHDWPARIQDRTAKSSDCPHCAKSRGYSKGQIYWLESIMKEENIKIQYALSLEGEFKIPGIGHVDGYCAENNTVYEYHGDYWHGNPSIYHPDDINKVNKKSFGELYQKTIERDEKIRQMGYNLIVKWESEFDL